MTSTITSSISVSNFKKGVDKLTVNTTNMSTTNHFELLIQMYLFQTDHSPSHYLTKVMQSVLHYNISKQRDIHIRLSKRLETTLVAPQPSHKVIYFISNSWRDDIPFHLEESNTRLRQNRIRTTNLWDRHLGRAEAKEGGETNQRRSP